VTTRDAATELARRPLYAPIASLLAGIDATGAPDAARLDALLASADTRPLSGGGRPIRFAWPCDDALGYEARIFETGVVATRADNWHDAFNALVWMRFPRTKAVLNRLHHHALATGADDPSRRGAARDAATQFDESGIVVASADPTLTALLAAHAWRELFSERRADVQRHMRFLVLGHGLYDSLRAPFVGLCGKAAVIDVDEALLGASESEQLSMLDQRMAERLLDPQTLRTPRPWLPLPVLGIPGVTPASEEPAYYQDVRQFRPTMSSGRRRNG